MSIFRNGVRVELMLVTALCVSQLVVTAQEKKTAPAQKPPETDDVILTKTELVQTDVMVFDKEGRFVDSLQREQFELYVEGKQQPVSFFESVVAGSAKDTESVKNSNPNARTRPPVEPATTSATVRGRTILFFINDLHMSPNNGSRMRDSLNYFIDRQMGENDQVAITSASGQIGFLQQMTNNSAVLKAAVARINYVPSHGRDNQRPTISEYAAYVIEERHDDALFAYFVAQTMKSQNVPEGIAVEMVRQRVRLITRQSDATVKVALSSLVELMRSAVKLPGRKLVYFISDGFVLNMSGSDNIDTLRRAIDAAARAGVVIYSIDARGLENDSRLDASESGGFDPTGVLSRSLGAERTFTQEPLYALAADTGGRALFDSNSMTKGITRGLDETSRYYLLAWRPESQEQTSSNFPNIKVAIPSRPDLKVQVRCGYFRAPVPQNATKTAPAHSSDTSAELVSVSEPSTAGEGLPTSLFLGYKLASGSNMQLTAAVQLNQQSGDGDQKKAQNVAADVLGAVFDSRGKSVGSFKQRTSVPPTSLPGQPAYANVNYQLNVGPGLYQVRVITRDSRNGQLGSTMDWIDIPNIKSGSFSMSSLFAGEIVAGETAGTSGSQVGVNAGGRFARTSRMRFTTYVYNASPDVGVQIQILRLGQIVITIPERKLATEKASDLSIIPYSGEFPLSALPTGQYTVQVTVSDHTKQATASQRINFTVY